MIHTTSGWREQPGATGHRQGIPLTSLFIDVSTVAADLNSITAMALLRLHKLVAAVAVLVVILVHNSGNQEAGFHYVAEWLAGVVGPVLKGVEQRF